MQLDMYMVTCTGLHVYSGHVLDLYNLTCKRWLDSSQHCIYLCRQQLGMTSQQSIPDTQPDVAFFDDTQVEPEAGAKAESAAKAKAKAVSKAKSAAKDTAAAKGKAAAKPGPPKRVALKKPAAAKNKAKAPPVVPDESKVEPKVEPKRKTVPKKKVEPEVEPKGKGKAKAKAKPAAKASAKAKPKAKAGKLQSAIARWGKKLRVAAATSNAGAELENEEGEEEEDEFASDAEVAPEESGRDRYKAMKFNKMIEKKSIPAHILHMYNEGHKDGSIGKRQNQTMIINEFFHKDKSGQLLPAPGKPIFEAYKDWQCLLQSDMLTLVGVCIVSWKLQSNCMKACVEFVGNFNQTV